jgi:hypothetical protein
MAHALERVWDASIKVIYHKIDSTLRGAWRTSWPPHVGAWPR